MALLVSKRAIGCVLRAADRVNSLRGIGRPMREAAQLLQLVRVMDRLARSRAGESQAGVGPMQRGARVSFCRRRPPFFPRPSPFSLVKDNFTNEILSLSTY